MPHCRQRGARADLPKATQSIVVGQEQHPPRTWRRRRLACWDQDDIYDFFSSAKKMSEVLLTVSNKAPRGSSAYTSGTHTIGLQITATATTKIISMRQGGHNLNALMAALKKKRSADLNKNGDDRENREIRRLLCIWRKWTTFCCCCCSSCELFCIRALTNLLSVMWS